MCRSSPSFRPKNIHPARGFTLIELLVVVAIIAILAGLLLPAGAKALDSAKKTTAKQQAVSIATAIAAYETEYGRLPNDQTYSNVSPALVSMLCSSNDTNNNSRGLVFLEATSWKTGKGGTNSKGFCDPFSATAVYSVALDTNYASTISVPASSSNVGTFTNISKHIGVWTIWINKGQTNLINSWD